MTTDAAAAPSWPEVVRRWTVGAHALLSATDATVVFGGHFSSGKSTLINALIGRPLLPTGALPETGLACVLRRGDRDEAVLSAAGERVPVRCDTAALAGAVSLIGRDGDYRHSVLEYGGHLEIRLAGAPIPAGAVWVDSPGINDRPDMTERAAAICAAADVLVWVVNSAQPLSMAEQEFLIDYLDANGPDSMVFAVNVFLPHQSPDGWERYLAARAKYHRDRIVEQIGGHGMVEPVLVCAQAVGTGQAGYGGPEIRDLVGRTSAANAPLVRRARAGRTAAHAATLAARVRIDLDAAWERRRADLAQAAREARRREEEQAGFARAVGQLAERRFFEWSMRADQTGQQNADRLSTGPIARDGSLGRALRAALQQAADELVNGLARGAAELAGRMGWAGEEAYWPEQRCWAQLAELLQVGPITIEVAGKLDGRLLPNPSPLPSGSVSRVVGGLLPSLSYRTLKRIDDLAVSGRTILNGALVTAENVIADRDHCKANVVGAANRVQRRLASQQDRAVAVIHKVYSPPPAAFASAQDGAIEEMTLALDALAQFTVAESTS